MKNKNIFEVWIKRGKGTQSDRIVEVPIIEGVYTPEEMKRMIQESGIPEKEWMRWRDKIKS